METLGDLARKTLVQYADEIAVKDPRGEITFTQLKETACQLSHALLAEGLTKGDRVAILMSNRREHVELDLAIAWTGLVKVPINYRLHSKEMEYILKDSGATIVIGEARLLNEIEFPFVKIDVDLDYDSFIGKHRKDFPSIEVRENDLFAIMYTSGTTGKPKGAMLTHRNMISSALSLNQACNITYGDVLGHVAPLTHGSNFLSQCALFFGLKQVIFTKFNPEEFIDDLEKEKVSITFLVPTLVNLMIHATNFAPQKLRYIKSINMAGSPIAVEKLNKALSLLGPKLAETYGLVEAPMAITIMPKNELSSKPDSCGAIGPFVEVKIVGENDKEVPLGEIGEVTCRGSLVMRGYWRNERATTEAFKDGWFYTGDLGYLDENGYLRLVDRAKDVIITGGLNVYPREVEEVLNLHPDVKETCVFGYFDDKWGESICAFVVLTDEEKQVTKEELVELCKQHLANYKKPRIVEIVQELPKNSYGKIVRKALRDGYKVT